MTGRGAPVRVASDRLTSARRARELEQLATDDVDVLVVGGGITGVGVALDAASRGLSVALVERGDLASGTSRWSSKLIHGGLRYLASGDVGLAYESARERALLMGRLAPHLVHPLPFVLPFGAEVSPRAEHTFRAGYAAAEAVSIAARTPHGVLPSPRRISAAEVLRWAPGLAVEGLRGGMLSWDGQLEDDARLVVAVARTAAAYGARILPYVAASALRADGATLHDRTGAAGGGLPVRARAVVNATGVWADTLDADVRLRPSRGSHLVLGAGSVGSPRSAVTMPVPGERNRYVFLLPQPDGLVYLGLTDDPVAAVDDEPVATEADVDFLLATASHSLARPLTRADVLGSFAGLRPLVDGAAGRTADLSRRHLVTCNASGVTTVVGGKLTTWRRMAQDTVGSLEVARGLRCRTPELSLVGAWSAGAYPAAEPVDRLRRRYGSEAPDLAALATAEPDLARQVAPGAPTLGVELAWGVLAEGALTVADLLARRTRLSMVPSAAAAAADAAHDILERFSSVSAPRVSSAGA